MVTAGDVGKNKEKKIKINKRVEYYSYDTSRRCRKKK